MNTIRILIVDDNAANLKLATAVLECADFELLQAMDAEQALQVIASTPPALILMDIGLPGMDGLTLTRKLKDDPATRHIKIVAFTAFAMKSDEERICAAGCDGYITKPAGVRELPLQVRAYLQQP
jgi:CheY-like chemotaxis protein